jgi:hypothetical protein
MKTRKKKRKRAAEVMNRSKHGEKGNSLKGLV